ncbi:MAG: HIT domain-containing protein, partial [Mycoplasmataceae bacterium]|nr:HIT domain-containing protein [Mycoplasmataceae bacterium]
MEKTIFQKIIDKEADAKILFENKKVIAFYDINPKTKGHFLVVPKV